MVNSSNHDDDMLIHSSIWFINLSTYDYPLVTQYDLLYHLFKNGFDVFTLMKLIVCIDFLLVCFNSEQDDCEWQCVQIRRKRIAIRILGFRPSYGFVFHLGIITVSTSFDTVA